MLCTRVYISFMSNISPSGPFGHQYKLQLVSHYLIPSFSPLSLDGRQQVMACTLLSADLPPDHGFLQFVYSAQCAR